MTFICIKNSKNKLITNIIVKQRFFVGDVKFQIKNVIDGALTPSTITQIRYIDYHSTSKPFYTLPTGNFRFLQ
jgi:hypothetical protein